MAAPEESRISTCTSCGRLFGGKDGTALCDRCAGTGAVQSEPAERRNSAGTLTPPPAVPKAAAIVNEERMGGNIGRPLCVRCKKRPASENTEVCLHCSLDLHKRLGSAASEVASRVEFAVASGPHPTNVVVALQEKRARTATSRIDPIGPKRLKY